MRRRRVLLGLGLLALIAALVALLWPREPEPRPAERAAARPHPRKPRPVRPRPPEAPEGPEAADEATSGGALPLALPAPADTGPAPLASLNSFLVLVRYAGDEIATGPLVIVSRDCGIYLRGEGGKPVIVRTEEDSCEVRAGRRDGLLTAWSDPVVVDTTQEGQIVDLEIPREETGGLGVAFALDDGGMLVTHVWPGSPADRMGLQQGDLIVEVDGLPTETLDEDDFISVMTGPVGSDVDFVVGSESDTGWVEDELTLTRERIDSAR